MLPRRPKLAREGRGQVAPRERGEIQAGKAKQQAFGAPLGRLQRHESLGAHGAQVAGEIGVDGQPAQRALAHEPAAQVALGLERGKGAADALERERVEGDVGRERERVPARIQMHGAGGRARRAVGVLLPRGPPEGHVPKRPVEHAGRGEPALDDHRRREQTHGAEVDVRPADFEVGEGEAAVAGGADDSLPGDPRHGPARHALVGEGPVDVHVHRVQEPRAGHGAAERAVERQRVDVGPRRVEVELAQRDLHVAEPEPAPAVGDRHQRAVDPLVAVLEVQVADVVRRARAGLGLGRQDAAAGHRGEIGRHPMQVVEVDVGRRHLEIEQRGVVGPGQGAAAGEPGVGQRAARQAEDRAVAVQADAADGVPQGHRRVVDPRGERVDVHRERQPVRRR